MKKVVIIGGGNSVSEGIDKGLWEKIQGQDIWSLNFCYMTMGYLPTRQVWVDVNFFKKYTNEMQSLSNKGVRLDTRFFRHYDNITEVNTHKIFRFHEELKKSTEPDLIYIGEMGLCGMFSLGLAIKEKYDIIFALGMDFGNNSIDNKQTHYYQGKLDIKSNGVGDPKIYRVKKDGIETLNHRIKDFEYYKTKAEKNGIKIYNVSINSNIDCFEKITWKNFFDKIEVKNGI